MSDGRGGLLWERRHKSDPDALELASRHYSRRTPEARQIGPPGRKVVLVTPDAGALWLSHWPVADVSPPLDGIDGFRCSIFRREHGPLASELIIEAMALTEEVWGLPPEGWLTWVETKKVASPNPGYCFLRAGWWRDDAWSPARGRRGKVRLRASSSSEAAASAGFATSRAGLVASA